MKKIASLKISKIKKANGIFYAIYIPSYLAANGKGTRVLFRNKAEAERKRAELVAATRTESRETVLTNAQLVDARRALERLSEAGVDISLDRAIELALPLLKSTGSNVTVRKLMADFGELKAASWRRHTAVNYRQASAMLCERVGDMKLTELSPSILGAWLAEHERPAYIAWLTRTIRPAFSYAVRQGMLPESPFNKLEPVRVPARASIDIFTPEEARRLMETAPADCKVAFALLLFAGVRPVELTKMTWAEIRADFIHLTPDVTKTAQVRNVEIEPTLAAWLEAYRPARASGRVCPTNWKRKSQDTRREAGLAGRQDTARHSYASYYLAKYKNKDALEANMGHAAGGAVLMRHYRAAATPAEAADYWSILP